MEVKAVLLAAAGVTLLAGCGTGGGQQVLVGAPVSVSPVTASPEPAATITPAPSIASASAGTASASPATTVTASPTRSATVSPSPTSSTSTTLTESDSGRTITVAVGQSLTVRLPGGSSGGYDQPRSSASAVYRVSATGGYPTDQPAIAHFTAASVGTANLTSTTDYKCLHTQPRCAVPQRQWIVHVIVH